MEEKSVQFNFFKCYLCDNYPFFGINYSKFFPEIEQICEKGHFLRIKLEDCSFDLNQNINVKEKMNLKYLNKEQKDSILNNMKICENKLNNIKLMFRTIKELLLKEIEVIEQKFNKYYKENIQEICFMKYLYTLYEKEEKNQSLNINFIDSFKSIFNFNIESFEIHETESIYKKAEKLINYLSVTDNYLLKESNLNEKYKQFYMIQNTNLVNKKKYEKDISMFKEKKEINTDTLVLNILQLKKINYIVASLANNNIYVYDSNLTLKYIIDSHSSVGIMYDMLELRNGKLLTSSNHKYLRIFNIKENEYEIFQLLNTNEEMNLKVIEFQNGKIMSCSYNNVIIFGKQLNYYFVETKIQIKSTSIYDINKNEFLINCLYDDIIIFFNKNTYEIISKLHSLLCSNHIYSMVVINNFLFISGNGIYIININNHQLIEKIDYIKKKRSKQPLNPLILLNNNHILSFKNENYDIYGKEWKLEGNNLLLISEKYMGKFESINSIIQLENNNIIYSNNAFFGMKLLE